MTPDQTRFLLERIDLIETSLHSVVAALQNSNRIAEEQVKATYVVAATVSQLFLAMPEQYPFTQEQVEINLSKLIQDVDTTLNTLKKNV